MVWVATQNLEGTGTWWATSRRGNTHAKEGGEMGVSSDLQGRVPYIGAYEQNAADAM